MICENKCNGDVSGIPYTTRRFYSTHSVVRRIEAKRGSGQAVCCSYNQPGCTQCTSVDYIPVTRLTQRSCTGMSASGMPSTTVKKILTTSPMFEDLRYIFLVSSLTSSQGHKQSRHSHKIPNELLRVLIDAPALFNRLLDRSKVIVCKDHVRCQLGDICPRSHCNAD